MIKYISYYNSNSVWLILLIASRIFGAMSIAVLFNDKWLTKMMKMLLAVLMAFIIYPYCNVNYVTPSSLINEALLLCKELIVGATLGYMFSFPFWVIQSIGNIIDMQRGEQFGAIINQTTNNPSSSIGNLLLQGYLGYLVSINGIIFFFQMIFSSFKIILVNGLFKQNIFFGDSLLFIKYFEAYFYWVIVLVLPIIASMFLLDMVLGLIGSFVPAMNITVVAMPIKGVLAMFLLTFYVGILYHVDTIKFFEQIKIYLHIST